jgi:hypothetical protein
MRLGRGRLAAAAIVAVLAGVGTALIVADDGSQARPASSRPWPVPAATRTVSIVPGAPSPSSTPSPRPAKKPKLAPNSVAIPAQHVRAPIIDTCQIVAGTLEPPSDVHQICYWGGGPGTAAHAGTTVLTGHINWVGQGTGAFGNLALLHRGDTVYTSDGRHAITAWRIIAVQHRSKSRGVDAAAFVGHRGPRRLYLISCGGAFDAAELSYVDNIYVRARPVPIKAPAPPAPPPPPLSPLPKLN